VSCSFAIAPTYAPLLLVSKYHAILGSRIFRIIRSGHVALIQFIEEARPDWIVLSLADMITTVSTIREYAQTLLSLSSETGVQVLMDSGGLERAQIRDEYFQDPSCLDVPLLNLREQLSLNPASTTVTLLDDLRLASPLEGLLRVGDGLAHEIENRRDKSSRILLVIHRSDESSVPALRGSRLFGVINEIALTEKELVGTPSLEEIGKLLNRQLVVFGLDDLSLSRLHHHLRSGAYLGDSAAWLTRQLTTSDWSPSVRSDRWKVWDNSWQGLSERRLAERLYDNLMFLRETERKISGETRS